MPGLPAGEPAHYADSHRRGVRHPTGMGPKGIWPRVVETRGHVLPVSGRIVPEDAKISDSATACVLNSIGYRLFGSKPIRKVSID